MLTEIDELSEKELEELTDYSANTDNLEDRYILACSIISNMTKETNPKEQEHCSGQIVDLSICKLLIDDVVVIEVEVESKYFH